MAEQAWVEFEKMFDQLAGSSDEEDEDNWSCQKEKKGQLRNPFFLVKLRQVSILYLINQINSVGISWSSSLIASFFIYAFILVEIINRHLCSWSCLPPHVISPLLWLFTACFSPLPRWIALTNKTNLFVQLKESVSPS